MHKKITSWAHGPLFHQLKTTCMSTWPNNFPPWPNNCQLDLTTANLSQQLACQLATSWQFATCNLQLAICNLQFATCNLQLATCQAIWQLAGSWGGGGGGWGGFGLIYLVPWNRGLKSIAIFGNKQWLLSPDMKTKLVQHDESEWMRDWESVKVRECESVRV